MFAVKTIKLYHLACAEAKLAWLVPSPCIKVTTLCDSWWMPASCCHQHHTQACQWIYLSSNLLLILEATMTQLTTTETAQACQLYVQVTVQATVWLPGTEPGNPYITTHLHTCLFPSWTPVLSQSAADNVHCHKPLVSLLLQGGILERAAQMHVLQHKPCVPCLIIFLDVMPQEPAAIFRIIIENRAVGSFTTLAPIYHITTHHPIIVKASIDVFRCLLSNALPSMSGSTWPYLIQIKPHQMWNHSTPAQWGLPQSRHASAPSLPSWNGQVSSMNYF